MFYSIAATMSAEQVGSAHGSAQGSAQGSAPGSKTGSATMVEEEQQKSGSLTTGMYHPSFICPAGHWPVTVRGLGLKFLLYGY